jgi:hypothetical protein
MSREDDKGDIDFRTYRNSRARKVNSSVPPEAKRHLLAINTDPKVLVDAAQNRNFAARGDGTAYERIPMQSHYLRIARIAPTKDPSR